MTAPRVFSAARRCNTLDRRIVLPKIDSDLRADALAAAGLHLLSMPRCNISGRINPTGLP